MAPIVSSASSSPSAWSTTSDPSSPESAVSYSSSSSPTQTLPLPHRTKTARSEAKSKTFLWIDSQADDGKGSTVRKQKQAFVVKKIHEERKKASIERLKATKPPPPAAPPKPSLALERSGTIQRAIDDGQEGQEEDITRPSPEEAIAMAEAWSLMPYLSQGFMDPFNCYSIDMTSTMHMYLDYFRIHGTAAAYPLNGLSMGVFLWKNAITIPALLNILLYFSAKHLTVLGSKNGVSAERTEFHTKDSWRLQGNALKHLNNLLQDPKRAVTQPTIITIACFITIEASMANLEAVEAHLKGLKRLVDLIGGLDSLAHMTLSRLYQCDVKGASVRQSRPIFPMSPRFRSGIIHESNVLSLDQAYEPPLALTTLGRRFTSGPWFADIDMQLQASVEICRRIILYFESARIHPELGTPTDNDLLVCTEHQLHSLSFPTGDSLNEPLRLSLLIYLNTRVWHLGKLPIMGRLVGPLKASLVQQLPFFQALAPDLIFWILFMGGMAARAYPVYPWFVTRLAETATLLGVREWGEVRALLGEFFYTNQPGETPAEDLWDEVLLDGAQTYIAPTGGLQVLHI
ncbi:hypothetical protein ASPCAL01388 [Aspergillus calidoustus]|uniref:Uncharacterized protein n=1 Tax=Aspergillus calidoustus TaxID=454130 RepID=A0A0U5FQM8_ASPCI|nr:hypothetical protein ASPCAL01388 [Aspergillus calidoustus]